MASEPTEFADFTPPPAALVKTVDRSKYAGRPPEVAAPEAIADYAAMRSIEPSTLEQKTMVMRRILKDLAGKRKDLATVDQPTLASYRAFLQKQVEQGKLSQNYAYLIVKDWNALVTLLFGETSKPGEGLKMKGFSPEAKQVQHLEMEEIDQMIQGLATFRFQNDHIRQATRIFMELAVASAARWDSIASPLTTFACVDYVAGTIRFREVKNKHSHESVLTARCLEALKRHETFLRGTRHWIGMDTPILIGPRGTVLQYQTIRNALHGLAAQAGIRKPVTTHLFRKSVGTHMARENPRLAREQLGITAKVFEAHYNQPTVKDRLERRDLLMGSESRSSGEEARIGALYLQLRRGLISQQEFDREANKALLRDKATPRRREPDPGFA